MLRFIVGITGFMLVPFLIPFVAVEAAYRYVKASIMEEDNG